ncbi:response regulator transcription factor [Occultella gossypii]|uniref:Response regulator transcription factor n=1 Tax=Occultella gossypii TaxID=2800820 RepID=A0ABS7SKB2_9MICO|nr:response regulator transcription factor [Occultella gossypii]MBZ2199718.1 response regulator transcription factor [Occultella gossypii]
MTTDAPNPTSVVVADDQPVVLAGLAAMIDSALDLAVVATASDGEALLSEVARHRPDVAVVDVRMPRLDGIGATRRICREYPDTHVLILTTFDLDEYVYDALLAGASGFLLKDVTAPRLIEAVRMIADGSMLLGPTATRRLVHEVAARSATAPHPGMNDLSDREREVLLAVARGLSNAEIAAELTVSENTVKTHISQVLRKLDARSRVQLVIAAYDHGLVR